MRLTLGVIYRCRVIFRPINEEKRKELLLWMEWRNVIDSKLHLVWTI